MATTPSPGLGPGASPLSWHHTPTRAESVLQLRRDIGALKDPTRRVASLDAKSRALQEHVAECRDYDRDALQREERVMKRYASATRKAFARHFEEQRRAESVQRGRDARHHQQILEANADRRAHERFVLSQAQSVLADDIAERVASVKAERHALYHSEMADWTARVSTLRQQESERLAVRDQLVADQSAHEDRDQPEKLVIADQQRVMFAEAAGREAVFGAEIKQFRALRSEAEHDVNGVQKSVNRRQKAKYHRSLAAKREAARHVTDVLQREASRRASMIRLELDERREIVQLFRSKYDTLVALSRAHHGSQLRERLAERRRAESAARKSLDATRQSGRVLAARQRQIEAEERHATAADHAQAERETRLVAVRDAEQHRVESVQHRRLKTLMLLRGEKAPSETAPFRVAKGLSRVRETLPSDLRDQVIQMIREH